MSPAGVEGLAFDSLNLQDLKCTIQWLPSAHDFLEVLQKLGYTKPTERGSKSSAKQLAAPPASAPISTDLTHLNLVLQVLVYLCHMYASNRLVDLSLPEGHGRMLMLALLHLQLDAHVRVAALSQLQEALLALINAFDDTQWGRMSGDMAARIADSIGPSHRSAVLLLSELPTSSGRAVALKRQASLLLLKKLLKKPDQVGG